MEEFDQEMAWRGSFGDAAGGWDGGGGYEGVRQRQKTASSKVETGNGGTFCDMMDSAHVSEGMRERTD